MVANYKTNVIRILEAKRIKHQVYEYSADDGCLDAISVAQKIGLDPDIVFKTLVTIGKNTGVNIFVIPGTCELDLKKAAEAARDKSISMVKSKELLPLTGYVHGGCSPIGMKKSYSTFLEEMALGYESIVISAGKIGLQVRVDPQDLITLTNANCRDLV